jgi:hydrogenase-4 membrane subunit HyfE
LPDVEVEPKIVNLSTSIKRKKIVEQSITYLMEQNGTANPLKIMLWRLKEIALLPLIKAR